MCRNCSNKSATAPPHPPPSKRSGTRSGCEPVKSAAILDFSQELFPQLCSYGCKRRDGRRDKRHWLQSGLVSSHLWACRCWFTGSDHTELTGGNWTSSLLLSLILLSFLRLPCRSNALGHTSISSLWNAPHNDSVLMRDKRVDVLRAKKVFGISLQIVCSAPLYYLVFSGLLSNHAKTQWAKIPNTALRNVFAVRTVRRLLINALTSELSLVKLRQWGENIKNRSLEVPNMKCELSKPLPSVGKK